MSGGVPAWLTVERGTAPLIVSVPHAGTVLPPEIERALVSPWIARKDADWYVDRFYDFATQLGATTVRTAISRTVVDVNRPPDGSSLYPGQTTTGLCPLTTFDLEPLYLDGRSPDARGIEMRREHWHAPYHAALVTEIERLRASHRSIVLYDAHSIRSRVPALFAGSLPVFNLGFNDGQSCDAALARSVAAICADSGQPHVVDGRFKGGYITRHYGRPAQGVHALQMELACRGYLREPSGPLSAENWPPPYDAAYAAKTRALLQLVLETCLDFAATRVARGASQ
jgi:N-formylglutamate deformylase